MSHLVYIVVIFLILASWVLIAGAKGGLYRSFHAVLPEHIQVWLAKRFDARLVRRYHSPIFIVRERMRSEKAGREIYEAISFARNLIASGGSTGISSQTLLADLSARGGVLKKAFENALARSRLGQNAELIEGFVHDAGVKGAEDFIRVVVRWDMVSPEKLASTLLSYQHAMKEMRTTGIKKRIETLSDLLFLPVIINVMLVFLNFVIVGYFLGQKDMLTRMFL